MACQSCKRMVVLLSVLVASAPSPSVGDGTYVKFGPGGVVPLNNEDIQLVRETVDLQVKRKHLLDKDSRLQVTVSYVFRNHSDRAVRVHMGFPVGLDFREQYMQGQHHLKRSRRDAISRFRATVDGRSVAVRLVRSRKRLKFPVGRFPGVSPPNLTGHALKMLASKQPLFDRYHVWAVRFRPGQQRTVVNRYRYNAASGIYRPLNEVRYVLRTGASWRGRIEAATIRLRLGDKGCISGESDVECFTYPESNQWMDDSVCVAAAHTSTVTPPNPKRRVLKNGSIEYVWSLTNFEPDKDVHFFYRTARAVRHGLKQDIAKAIKTTKDPLVLRHARDTLLALYGLVNANADVQARMAKKGWFVADAKMTRARLRNDRVLAKTLAALRRLRRSSTGR